MGGRFVNMKPADEQQTQQVQRERSQVDQHDHLRVPEQPVEQYEEGKKYHAGDARQASDMDQAVLIGCSPGGKQIFPRLALYPAW